LTNWDHSGCEKKRAKRKRLVQNWGWWGTKPRRPPHGPEGRGGGETQQTFERSHCAMKGRVMRRLTLYQTELGRGRPAVDHSRGIWVGGGEHSKRKKGGAKNLNKKKNTNGRINHQSGMKTTDGQNPGCPGKPFRN